MIAAALRLALAADNAGLTMDSPLYVHMAESLARLEDAPGPAHHGYSALVALAGLALPGRELPGRAVSMLCGLGLVLLVYRLARRSVPPWAATLAAALVAVHPLLAVYSGPIMTESTFLAVLFSALLALAYDRPLAAGLGFGLSYAVRPEGLVAAAGALLLQRSGWRRAGLLAAGFVLIAAPYVGYLSWERGTFTLTPKAALVHPPASGHAAEWRVQSVTPPPIEPERSLPERIRWAAPEIAKHYLPNLAAHLGRLVEAWPWPLLILSLAGLLLSPGPVAGILLQLLVIPMLVVAPEPRFAMLYLPALAVLAAVGAAALVARLPRGQTWAARAAVALAVAGVGQAWWGPPAWVALHFDDGPMAEMRAAGDWLRANGRPGQTVMDRKAYVPFFAGMGHVQLPDDDYETIVEYARASGVDYLVLEEYVVETLRPQLLPLIADAAFREREGRLRDVFHVRGGPHTGVVVMAVVPRNDRRDGRSQVPPAGELPGAAGTRWPISGSRTVRPRRRRGARCPVSGRFRGVRFRPRRP